MLFISKSPKYEFYEFFIFVVTNQKE